jgi:hypothetical protein
MQAWPFWHSIGFRERGCAGSTPFASGAALSYPPVVSVTSPINDCAFQPQGTVFGSHFALGVFELDEDRVRLLLWE